VVGHSPHKHFTDWAGGFVPDTSNVIIIISRPIDHLGKWDKKSARESIQMLV
jgi:hypothetical protein